MPQYSDSELMEHVIGEGDEDAFAMIVCRYQRLIFGIARKMLADEDLARDMCQHVWIQLFLAKPFLDVPLQSWLVTVVRRRCIDELRQKKRQALPFSLIVLESEEEDSMLNSLIDTQPLPEALFENREGYQQLLLAMEQLSKKMRLSFYLHKVCGYSFREIAGFLHEKENTVKTRSNRACLLLREFLISPSGGRAR
jgi:RNA polymerase sigma-70 factor, ECF subfamily